MKRRTDEFLDTIDEKKEDVFIAPSAPSKKRKIEEEPKNEELMDISINFDELDISEEELNKLLEDNPEVAPFDSAALKKLCLKFEKLINTNQQLRIEHKNTPLKFMQSELELDETVKEFSIIANNSNFYKSFINLGSFTSLVSLLIHENPDISLGVVDILYELFDADLISENKENLLILATEFMEISGPKYLLQNFGRLDDKEEEDSTGIYRSLSIIENILEIDSKFSDNFSNFIKTLLDKSISTSFSTNILYCSEVLSLLLQNNTKNQTIFVKECSGFDKVLTALARYRKKDPAKGEEEELVENFFVCTYASLLQGNFHTEFFNVEGLELILIFLRKKLFCFNGAVKVLDYALQDNEEGCDRFMKIFGLKTVFSIFMKKSFKKLKKYKIDENEVEMHISSTICSIFQHIGGVEYVRLLHKFVEENYAKVERVSELIEKNQNRLLKCELKIQNEIDEIQRIQRRKLRVTEEKEAEFHVQRLNFGLFDLRLLSRIALYLLSIPFEDNLLLSLDTQTLLSLKNIPNHLTNLLNMIDFSVENLKMIVTDHIAELKIDQKYLKLTEHLENLVSKF